MNNTRLSVIVWNEFIHERHDPAISSIYPEGIHCAIAKALKRTLSLTTGEVDISTATQDQPEHGLSKARLEACDVLIWWGQLAHDKVSDEVVSRIHRRVLEGMGIIVLHSGDSSKIFRRLLGTSSKLQWRASGEKELLWVVHPSHPIAAGLGKRFELPVEELYGENFDIAQPDSTVFISWFEGGEVFRSGCCWERGYGRLFYFRPGHIGYPTFHNTNVQRVLANAVQWAAPRFRFTDTKPGAQEGEDLAEDRHLCANRDNSGRKTSPLPALTNEKAARTEAHPRIQIEAAPLFSTLMNDLKRHNTEPKLHKNQSSRFAQRPGGRR